MSRQLDKLYKEAVTHRARREDFKPADYSNSEFGASDAPDTACSECGAEAGEECDSRCPSAGGLGWQE